MRIFAMGGGGFMMEPENPKLDRFIVSLTGVQRPRVCFLPNPGPITQARIDVFVASFSALGAEASTLSVFNPHTADLRGFLLSQHAIYVSGGNTRSALALWREWGVDVILREAWHAGVLLTGVSAGSICWFEHGVTDSIPGALTPLRCLGLLPGSHCPHYDGEPLRRPAYERLVGRGDIPGGVAADDYVGLLYEGTTLTEVVASRPERAAWRVERDEGAGPEAEDVRVERIPARLLE